MTNKTKRVYVDTSAVGGAFNKRIAEQTRPFWDAVQDGKIVVILSDVLDDELRKAPDRARNLVNDLPDSMFERIASTPESKELASRYIAENVVGPTSFDDCQHIALATLAKADVLVSWNFKHIVNVDRIKGYNGVNMMLGYSQIEIRTPYEVIHDEI